MPPREVFTPMIFLLALWYVLLLLSVTTGILARFLFHVSSLSRPMDNFILSLWLGFISLHVVFLAVALVVPLTPACFFLVLFAAVSTVLFCPPIRLQFQSVMNSLSWKDHLNILLWLLFCSAISVQTISNRDSVSYHFDIIYWLSRIGVTPGLALIHERLGYVSSWFTVPALFNHGFLSGRTGTLSNGFTLFLSLLHVHTCLLRVLRAKAHAVDLFILFAIPITLLFPVVLNYNANTTPDFVIVIIPLIISWVMLLALYNSNSAAPRPNGVFRDPDLVPLFLAACAFTIKIVAAPMLVLTYVYYLFRKKFAFHSLFTGAVTAALPALPLMISRTLLSGCPLDPVPVCFDLPWTIWRDRLPLKDFFSIVWHMYLEPASTLSTIKVAFVLLLFCAFSLVLGVKFLRSHQGRLWPVPALGVSGLVFLAAFVPTPRFAWGYMSIIICFPLLAYHRTFLGYTRKTPRFLMNEAVISCLSAALVAAPVAGASVVFETKSEKRLTTAHRNGTLPKEDVNVLLLPPTIPMIYYDDERNIALPHVGDRDKSDPLPDANRSMFYPLVPGRRVSFIDPEKGVRGGFRKSTEEAPQAGP